MAEATGKRASPRTTCPLCGVDDVILYKHLGECPSGPGTDD